LEIVADVVADGHSGSGIVVNLIELGVDLISDVYDGWDVRSSISKVATKKPQSESLASTHCGKYSLFVASTALTLTGSDESAMNWR
jgi:hypothetical protein